MADLTPDELAALLEERLRPVMARLDELSRKLDRQALRLEQHIARLDQAAEEARGVRFKRFLAVLSTVAVMLSLVVAGRLLIGGSGGGSALPAIPAAGRLLAEDDFSNPAAGLFLDHQSGTAALPPDRVTARWDFAYQGGALVAHVGPPTAALSGRVIGSSARASRRLTGDFAFEVKASAVASVAGAVYGLRLFPGGREFGFGVRPARQLYELWEIFQAPMISAQSSAIAAGAGANTLRLEVRGSALRLFVNGQAIDNLQDGAFGGRPASVGVFFDTTAGPTDPAVEIRFNDFKIYALGG